MSDTSWEDFQKRKSHSRLWIWLILVTLGVFLAGIILYNNRDYITVLKTPGNAGVSGNHRSREVFSADADLRKKPVDSGNAKTGAETGRQGAGGSPEKHGLSDDIADRDSIVIKNIICRVMDRNDIRINLSIRLFTGETADRRDLTVRREAMTVMVQKVLQGMLLEDVKKDKLKQPLLKEINTVFEANLFNDIIIENIMVEKVNTE